MKVAREVRCFLAVLGRVWPKTLAPIRYRDRGSEPDSPQHASIVLSPVRATGRATKVA
jgi:hypothetical protein